MLPGLPANTFSRGRAYRAQGSSCRGRTGRSLDLGLHADGYDSHADSRRRHPDDNGCGPESRNGFSKDQDSDGQGKEVTHLPGASASGEVRSKAPSEMAGPFFYELITATNCELKAENSGLAAENFGPTA